MNFSARILYLGLSLIVIAHSSACAQQADSRDAAQVFPPVEHASFHQVIFANEDFAVLNNRYPPGSDSGFHTHYRDIFSVVIQAAPSSGQRLGQPLTESSTPSTGAVAYGAIGHEPRTHRIVNGDTGPSQFIVIEMRRAAPLGNEVSTREAAPQYEEILDNERMRAWRLILAPGQSAPSIAQASNGLRVVVRGGLLTTTTPGSPDQTLELRAGEFAVQSGGSMRAVRNSGTETLELVELELK